jgi:hypothetical protein
LGWLRWFLGGRGWSRGFSGWEREHAFWRRWFLGTDRTEEGKDSYSGAEEGLEHTSLQPARRGIAHPAGPWVLTNRREMSLGM